MVHYTNRTYSEGCELKNNFKLLRRTRKITIQRHSELTALEQEVTRRRANPRASYPGLQTITHSRIEKVHTHIPQVLLLKVPKG